MALSKSHYSVFHLLLFQPFLISLFAATSVAWIYPEHRDITVLAIQKLDPARHAILDSLWANARTGYESRLSVFAADTNPGEDPSSIDYGAWPAIAGDHSVSGADLLHNVLETPWILGVAGVAAQLKNYMATATSRAARINYLRNSDIQLQRIDPQYATRAGSNNVHFLLARRSADIDTRTYLRGCLKAGTELNALGTYAWYHYSALLKAGRLSREALSPADRAVLARAALADEAFSLHFLEDAFAAGHVTGTWGDASLRKGTHDYYNESGFETRSWNGKPIVLAGDAWMRPADAELASAIISVSLGQFVDAVAGSGIGARLTTTTVPTSEPDTFNVARNTLQASREIDTTAVALFAETLLETPIPALGAGMGELPRFRAELGPFIGLTSAVFGGTLGGGFGAGQEDVGAMGGLSVAFRIGLGLEGVINESGDGLVFLDLGLIQNGASSQNIAGSEDLEKFGAITAQIPARTAFTMRLRAPFWLIPFDLLVAAPILAIVSPQTFVQMAVKAGSGGLIPWQAGMATFMGRFQFVLGREVAVAFFGYGKEEDRLFLPYSGTKPVQTAVVSLRSIQIEGPLLEYRPFRTFSMDQSSSLVMQLYGGVDIPTRISMVTPPDGTEPSLRTTWFAGLRFAFDWRYYLGSGTGVHR
jgi:hypothetical protein